MDGKSASARFDYFLPLRPCAIVLDGEIVAVIECAIADSRNVPWDWDAFERRTPIERALVDSRNASWKRYAPK